MKRFIMIALAVASIGVFGEATSYAAPSNTYAPGQAAGGIAGAKHNLGRFNNLNGVAASGATLTALTGGTTEICVFCHTPHHTNTLVKPAPLWNRGTNTATSNFIAYGSTIAGTMVNSSDIGSATMACLSCHDGITTLDNIVNAPGPGGVSPLGAAQGWTFTNDDGTAYGVSPNISGFDSGRLNIGSNLGNIKAGGNTTVDLSNDHPMSVVYHGDDGSQGAPAASLRNMNTVIAKINLQAGLSTTTINGRLNSITFDAGNLTRNYWAVKGFISSTATIRDLLRFRPNGNGYVECSSCHDPHFFNNTGASSDQGFGGGAANVYSDSGSDLSPDGLFLRRVGGNVGSGVCRTCHNK